MVKADPEADASDGKTSSRLAHACARAEDTNRREGQKRQRSTNDMKLRGGRGFNSLVRSRPATAPVLMRGFFLLAETFDYFPEIKHFKPLASKFLRRNKADRSAGYSFRVFIFRPSLLGSRGGKTSRNSRGGGGVP